MWQWRRRRSNLKVTQQWRRWKPSLLKAIHHYRRRRTNLKASSGLPSTCQCMAFDIINIDGCHPHATHSTHSTHSRTPVKANSYPSLVSTKVTHQGNSSMGPSACDGSVRSQRLSASNCKYRSWAFVTSRGSTVIYRVPHLIFHSANSNINY